MEHSTACPACGLRIKRMGGIEHFEMTRDEPYTATKVSYEACAFCGLVGKYPMPPEDDLKRYYGTSWQYESARPGYDLAARFIHRGLFDADGCGKFPQKAGPAMNETQVIGDRTILDVGSKGSQMAQELSRLGVDIDSAGGLDAQPVTPEVQQAWLGSGVGPTANHSIVSACHILEHVLRPDLFLQDLARLTASGGYIYLEVPSLRGGILDVGLCDDLNRNHLWHFGQGALSMLATQIGTLVAIETEFGLPGWPVDRVLIKKTRPQEESERCIQFIKTDMECEYFKASATIREHPPKNVALYGASHSYARLVESDPRLLAYRIFDNYKHGSTYSLSFGPKRERTIEPMEYANIGSVGSRTFFVTTRSYNSYVDIKKWLNRNHPGILVKTPYASIAAAVGEQ